MPTSAGLRVRTVGDIVQVLTKCSKSDADAAELEICKTPEAVATLLAACGISTYAVGMGGKLIVAGGATAGSTAVGGVIIGGLGLVGAKKFCSAAVDRALK